MSRKNFFEQLYIWISFSTKDKVKELENKINVLESKLASCMRKKGVGCRVCNRNDGTCGCSGVSDSCCEI